MATQALQPINSIEARILGSLVEKEATTPDQYPCTENAVQLACNQKTNRDPIMEVSLGDVGHALRRMTERGLVKEARSVRALRFEHRLAQVYALTAQQQALIAVLLLRGPQTSREIMTRTERLKGFADDDELLHTLERLQQRDAPLVVRIPKAAGQREDRFMHLLCGPVDVEALRASVAVAQAAPSGSLAERVAQLEARVEALERLINEKE